MLRERPPWCILAGSGGEARMGKVSRGATGPGRRAWLTGFLADSWEVFFKSVAGCLSELQRDQIKGNLKFYSWLKMFPRLCLHIDSPGPGDTLVWDLTREWSGESGGVITHSLWRNGAAQI